MKSSLVLPREALREFVDNAIAAARSAGRMTAVLVIGVKRADRLTELLGPAPGRVIDEVVAALLPALRKDDRVLVLSDEKLCIVLSGLRVEAQAALAASKVATLLEKPVRVEGTSISVLPVIGISLFPDHGNTAEALVTNADVAERIARSRDLAKYFFRQDDQSDLHAYLGLDTALREALHANELEVHYQPKVNLATGECDSVEGLLRWNAAGHGHVSPWVIIRLAEASGLIGVLTTWIANTIVRHHGEWRRDGIAISSSINLSAINLADSELPDVFGEILGTWRADPSLITLEITESSTIGDEEHSLLVLRRLKELGMRLSVDDFGTGYSSLSYVKRFPLDELKIDRLFVQHMLNSAADQAIVRSVLDLARNFNLSVVAEGVEDGQTMEALRRMGCDYAQGFHISKAIPSASLPEWIMRWNKR